VVGGWGVAAGRETLGRLYAGFSETRTPSDAPYTGFLSTGILSDIRSPNNETFTAVYILGKENFVEQFYLPQDQSEQQSPCLLAVVRPHWLARSC